MLKGGVRCTGVRGVKGEWVDCVISYQAQLAIRTVLYCTVNTVLVLWHTLLNFAMTSSPRQHVVNRSEGRSRFKVAKAFMHIYCTVVRRKGSVQKFKEFQIPQVTVLILRSRPTTSGICSCTPADRSQAAARVSVFLLPAKNIF